MSAEKISELDVRMSATERTVNLLLAEMKEDRGVAKQLNETQIKLTAELAGQNKNLESVLSEVKEMRKTQNELVTRVSVIESGSKSSDMVKRAIIGSVVGLLIMGALSGYFLKGG